MKKILITGLGSYIGESFCKYLMSDGEKYHIETVDVVGEGWKEKSFSGFDAVFHVAGIAHRKETPENRDLYYAVNTYLSRDIAKKAKTEGVGHFVFISSMSVYGMDSGIITKDTVPTPKSNYGKSKLLAEEEILSLSDNSFRVCILRPPMVYGKGCKGNFNTVAKLVRKLPAFPLVNNKRSMIYIDNLSSFVKHIIDNGISGIYMPQNKEYVNTSEMAKAISEKIGKKIFLSRLLGLGVNVLKPFVKMADKAFGTLIYKETEDFDYSYCVVSNDESYKMSID